MTRFRPDDVAELRNLMQAVIRALLSLETETYLFRDSEAEDEVVITVNGPASGPLNDASPSESASSSTQDVSTKVTRELAKPTREVISCMAQGLSRCHAALMDLSGYRKYLGPSPQVSSDIEPMQARMRQAKDAFDIVESRLLDAGILPASSIRDSEVVQLFVFARHVREAASTLEPLMVKVHAMQHACGWPRLHLPSYPFRKSLHRSNAQVRHDRGGVTAGSYQVTFIEIARVLDRIKFSEHHPLPRMDDGEEHSLRAQDSQTTADAGRGATSIAKRGKLRFKLWNVLYRFQGFESRYAFKVCLVTSLLSVPGYLERDDAWWDEYEAWWAVTLGWIAMHPRVGGNLQDLIVRAFLAILGAVWSGIAYAAGNGSPYVMAVFAAVYMIPMLYRYTLSSHPVSFGTALPRARQADGCSAPVLLGAYRSPLFLSGSKPMALIHLRPFWQRSRAFLLSLARPSPYLSTGFYGRLLRDTNSDTRCLRCSFS